MMKTIKKKTTSQLKKQLDKIFSLYIRKKYANENGEVMCYTCGVLKRVEEMQCGHFVSRSHLSTRFDESNVRPQCVGCNIFAGGRTAVFATNLDKDCGDGTSTRLYKKALRITKDFPYIQKIEEYKKKINDLQEN